PDAQGVTVVEEPQAADEPLVLHQQEMACRRLEIPTVEVGVRRGLLDHEDLLSQPPELVRRTGVEVVEGECEDADRHRRKSTTCVKARRASGARGSRPYTWMRSGSSIA